MNAALEAYYAELRARVAEVDSGRTRPEELDDQLKKAGVPGRAIGDLRKPLRKTEALRLAAEFIEADPRLTPWLVLLGAPGKGKTVAAAWVVREWVKRNGWNNSATGTHALPAIWVQAHRLTRVSSYDKLDGQWEDELRTVPLLVLDDAGDESTSQGTTILATLMTDRQAKCRRTVLTSNLTKTAIEGRYGKAVRDRLGDSAILGELGGDSMRQRTEGRLP